MVSIIRAEALPLRVGGRELGPSLLNGNLCRTPEGLIAFVSVGKLVFSTVDRKRGSVRAQRCHLLPSAVCTQLAAVSLAGCSVVVTTSADGCSVWHATSETPLHTVPLSALEGAAISLGSVLPDYNAGDSFARGIATLEEGSLLCVGTSSGVVAVLRAECEDSPRRLLLRSSAAPTLSLSVLKHIAHFEAADSARESAAPSLPTPMPVRAPCTWALDRRATLCSALVEKRSCAPLRLRVGTFASLISQGVRCSRALPRTPEASVRLEWQRRIPLKEAAVASSPLPQRGTMASSACGAAVRPAP